ncbi:MAG: hypothetical protein RIC89_08265 [Pseudomonadales bacterium]
MTSANDKKAEDTSAFLSKLEEFPYTVARVFKAYVLTAYSILVRPNLFSKSTNKSLSYRPDETVFLGPVTLFLLSLFSSFISIYVLGRMHSDELLLEGAAGWLELFTEFKFTTIARHLFWLMASIVGFGVLLSLLMKVMQEHLPVRAAVNAGFYVIGAAFAWGSLLLLLFSPLFGTLEDLPETTLVLANYALNGLALALLARFYFVYITAVSGISLTKTIVASITAPLIWLIVLPLVGLPVYFNIGPIGNTEKNNVSVEVLTEALRAAQKENLRLKQELEKFMPQTSKAGAGDEYEEVILSGPDDEYEEVIVTGSENDSEEANVIYLPDLIRRK